MPNDPFTAVVRVPINGSLGEVMMKTRAWLDSQKIQLFQFTTAVDGKGYACRFQFQRIGDADRFRAQFRKPGSRKAF